ncbi:MAG: RhuM family protein [Kofleriaceae bacterium]|nr:RhuM family protein [Kofleriaceae bacterium]
MSPLLVRWFTVIVFAIMSTSSRHRSPLTSPLRSPASPARHTACGARLGRFRHARVHVREHAHAADYDPSVAASQRFFATVQNKMHWAAHGKTAAEVIAERADATKPNMGLTSWAGPTPRTTSLRTRKVPPEAIALVVPVPVVRKRELIHPAVRDSALSADPISRRIVQSAATSPRDEPATLVATWGGNSSCSFDPGAHVSVQIGGGTCRHGVRLRRRSS